MSTRLAPRLDEQESIRRCGWPACKAACCVYGVWIGEAEIQEILDHADLVQPHMREATSDPATWFEGAAEKDPYLPSRKVRHTSVVDDPEHYGGTACIFLMPDYRCALQAAGESGGQHPWRFKPFYCILHPLDLDQHGRITLDEARLMVNEPASCLRTSSDSIVLSELFADEISYLAAKKR